MAKEITFNLRFNTFVSTPHCDNTSTLNNKTKMGRVSKVGELLANSYSVCFQNPNIFGIQYTVPISLIYLVFGQKSSFGSTLPLSLVICVLLLVMPDK